MELPRLYHGGGGTRAVNSRRKDTRNRAGEMDDAVGHIWPGRDTRRHP